MTSPTLTSDFLKSQVYETGESSRVQETPTIPTVDARIPEMLDLVGEGNGGIRGLGESIDGVTSLVFDIHTALQCLRALL